MEARNEEREKKQQIRGRREITQDQHVIHVIIQRRQANTLA
jgi:hypothetical protein